MNFKDLGLAPKLLARVAQLGFAQPTPIQEQAIPVALAGTDVLGIAQTGTGKTAAFGLPLVMALNGGPRPAPRTARGLVLAPTRELAAQIARSLMDFSRDLRVTLVVGGRSINAQVTQLSRGTDILVATPGRLIDLIERHAIDLKPTRFLVLDEADQMLDIGFLHALRRIAALLGRDRQTMMFSATMPKQMATLANDYLRSPVRIEATPPGQPAARIDQSVHFVPKDHKQALLVELLGAHPAERSLVFARTKHGAERLMKQLDKIGFKAASIHGNKSQGQRERALMAFRKGSVQVLVATDVAARGIDIPDVRHVYNFDLPNVAENYVHRIGRTARAGHAGEAVAFCAPEEMDELLAIEKVLGGQVQVAGGERWARPRGAAPQQRRKRRPQARGYGRSAGRARAAA